MTGATLQNITSEGGVYRYRFSSSRSAGHLESSKRQLVEFGPPLTPVQLRAGFDLHKNLSNRVPTALVSTTKDIVRALKGAYDQWYRHELEAKDVYLAIINIPPQGTDPNLRVHSAIQLARKIGLDERDQLRFKGEYLFEWKIPKRYVVQRVSLQTLHDRGFRMDEYERFETGTSLLRRRIYEASSSQGSLLTPCWQCSIQICADGGDLYHTPKVYRQEGCFNPWMHNVLGKDCKPCYSWKTACLSKVHANHEPSGQVTVMIRAIIKRHIQRACEVMIDELRSKLRQTTLNDEGHLLVLRKLEEAHNMVLQ